MSLVARIALLLLMVACRDGSARDLYILVIGDRSVANCHAHGFEPAAGVYQWDAAGRMIVAGDPFQGTPCHDGSIWIPFGQGAVTAKLADRVVLVPLIVPPSEPAAWFAAGSALERLKMIARVAQAGGVQFDYAFLQPGAANAALSQLQYFRSIRSVVRFVSQTVPVKGWIFAIGSGCGNVDPRLAEAQVNLGSSPIKNYHYGPRLSELPSMFWESACRLNRDGQEALARMWLRALIRAENTKARYDRETLLKYFR